MIHKRFTGRLLNKPQMIAPNAGAAVLEALLPGAKLLGYSDPPAADGRRDRDYQVAGTTAVIPCVGELAHRGSWMDAVSGVASYQALGDMIATALRDPGVEGIIIDLDSPGGEAAGCLDFSEWLASQRGTKPIWAIANQLACSAAYAIASACDRILIGESAYAGSIGVVAYHADISRALDAAGVQVSYIYAGARKVDGAPEMPLSADARAAAQAAVDAEYDRFCRVVAANRNLTVEAVRATEAGIYRGPDAVSAGLADAIATPEEALATMTTTTVTAPAGARMQSNTPTEQPNTPPVAAQALPASPPVGPTAPTEGTDEKPADPVMVADACAKAGHPGLIAPLLRERASMKAVDARLAVAKDITEAAKPLGLASLATQLVTAGVGLDAARGILFETKAAAGRSTPGRTCRFPAANRPSHRRPRPPFPQPDLKELR